MSLKFRFIILGALLLWLSAACSAFQPHEFGGVVFPEPQTVSDFALTAANDQTVHLSDFEGDYVFVYFGYTFCPDLCPDTLAKLALVRRELGDDAERMQVLMVSVDPERDTPERLAEYVSFFDDSFVGVTGTPEEIDAAGKPFGLYYEAHEGSSDSSYLVDHTARAFLLDPNGRLIVAYPYDASDEAILADMEYLLAQEG